MEVSQEKREQVFNRRAREVRALLKYYKTQEKRLKQDLEMSGKFRKRHIKMVAEGIEECEVKLLEIADKLGYELRI